MRFLADESVDVAVVRALRQDGHDVRAIAEERPGAPDDEIAQLARVDERVLITEDRDFGRLVFAELRATAGVVFLRYPAGTRTGFAHDVALGVRHLEDRLLGAFVVMQPGRIRVSRVPEP